MHQTLNPTCTWLIAGFLDQHVVVLIHLEPSRFEEHLSYDLPFITLIKKLNLFDDICGGTVNRSPKNGVRLVFTHIMNANKKCFAH